MYRTVARANCEGAGTGGANWLLGSVSPTSPDMPESSGFSTPCTWAISEVKGTSAAADDFVDQSAGPGKGKDDYYDGLNAT